MKLKSFAMITENKVIKIFGIVDDFCNVFDGQMAKYTSKYMFKAQNKRKLSFVWHRQQWCSAFQKCLLEGFRLR